MFPGCLLMPLFLGGAAFWVLGPPWSWVPFTVLFALAVVPLLLGGPARIATAAPSAAQSVSGTLSLTMLLAIGVAIGVALRGRWMDLIPCAVVFLISALLWPKLRTLGPM